MKKKALILIPLMALFLLPAPTQAVSLKDKNAIYQDRMYYEPGSGDCYEDGSLLSSQTGDGVPEPYRSLFNEAAAEYNVDPNIMAAVFYWENRGFPDPDTDWATSGGGAKGPWQFLDGTWEGYGVDANGDGVKDVQNLEDSSYGAANYIKSLGGIVGLEVGGLNQDFSEESANKETVAWVLKSYNAGPATYRNEKGKWYRPAGVWGSSKQIEINEYIENGVIKYREFAGGGSLSGSLADGCGSLGVSADGFVFPLRISKSELEEGAHGAVWNMLLGDCRDSDYGCHGTWGGDTDSPDDDTKHYYAADIHAPAGTPVVASRGGVVYIAHLNSDGAFAVVINGNDGNYYYYTHMGGSHTPVSEGDSVSAGQVIGEVGDRSDTGNGSASHVHFDIATQNVGKRFRGCSESNCPGMNYLLDPYEALTESYEELR